VPRLLPSIVTEFQRSFDELFDELLIGPWRSPATENEPAMVREREDAYEVRLCTGNLKPPELEVVISPNRLTVRARHGAGTFWERLLSFTDPVETDKVSARWANRILTVVLPKQATTVKQRKTTPKRPRSEKK
jgi:HSP20 family molecular chaperone IbpA